MLFVIIVIAIILIGIMVSSSGSGKRIADLKNHYDQSLKQGDKKAALDAGYSALRNGKTLTIYDEQSIINDLSTMN